MAKNFSKVKDEFTIGYNSNFFDEQIYLCLYGIIRTPFQKSKKVIYNDTKDTHIGIALGLFNNKHKPPTTGDGSTGSVKPPTPKLDLTTKNILEDITLKKKNGSQLLIDLEQSLMIMIQLYILLKPFID